MNTQPELTHRNVCDIVSVVDYKDWTFRVGLMEEGFFLQVRFWEKDIDTQEPALQSGRKWYISRFATKSEIVFTCLAAVKMAELHELHERFTYKGKRLVDPHVDVESLIQANVNQDARQHLDLS